MKIHFYFMCNLKSGFCLYILLKSQIFIINQNFIIALNKILKLIIIKLEIREIYKKSNF
jgi:hypothetical protein